MCLQRNIKIVSYTNTIDFLINLNESQIHLNKHGTIEFTKNFKKFLYNLNSRDLGNSEGFDQYEVNFPNFVRNMLHSDHNGNLNEKGSQESIIVSEYNNYNDSNDLIDNLTDIR